MSNAPQLVQKLWNYCNILRDDGLSYGDYVEQLTRRGTAAPPPGCAPWIEVAGNGPGGLLSFASMNAIQHIAFHCRDLTAQEQFYTKHFGFRRARVFNRGTPNEFLMLRLGATCLELFAAPAAAKKLLAKPQPVGFTHLAFAVDDLDAAVAQLQADGIPTEPIIDCSSIMPGARVCFFQYPDGNRVELMQGYADEF